MALRFSLPSLVLSLLACDSGSTADTPDARVIDEPDASAACPDPTVVLPTGWTPIGTVSAGAVSSTAAGGVTTTLVDATAGGFMGSADEPYVYVSFDGAAAKVSISDVDSYGSDAWDIALKRYVIRVNSGDSGPGGVRVAAVSAGAIADVTAVPGSGFEADDWATPTCTLVSEPLGAPLTAIGEWYMLDAGTLTPLDFVYVLDLGGAHVKLEIDSYYAQPGNPMTSAYFRLLWAPL